MKSQLRYVFLLLAAVFSFASHANAQTPSTNHKLDSLLAILKHAPADTARVSLLEKVGKMMARKDPGQAKVYLNEGLDLARKLNYGKKIAGIYTIFGSIYMYAGDSAASVDHYNKALHQWRSMNDSSGIANIHYLVGQFYYNRGELPMALINHAVGLDIRERLGEKINLGNSYNAVGIVYYQKGDYPEALKYFHNALKVRRGLDDKFGVADVNNNIGIIYEKQADYKEALKYHNIALGLRKEIDNKTGIATSYNNIGVIQYKQGDHAAALESYKACLAICEEIGDQYGTGLSYNNIGSVHSEAGNYPEALANYQKALELWSMIENSIGMADAHFSIGCIYAKMKDLKKAALSLQESLRLSHESNYKDGLKDAYHQMAKIDSAQGNFLSAYENYKQFVVYRDSLLNEENTEKIVRAEMNFEFDKREHEAKLKQEQKDALAAEEKRQREIIMWAIAAGLLLVVVFAIFVYNRFRVTQKQKRIIEEQKLIVEEKNKDITDSINYARRIQRTLLASDSFLHQHLPDHFVLFKPKDIVSGDFYWSTEKNGRFYLAVCDSTGHGVPGAFMSLLNISFLNEAINEKGIVQPSEVLNHTRKRLIENISQEGARDGMDGILLCIDKNSRTVSYAAANNAPVMANGQMYKLNCDSMPVGLSDRTESFNTYIVNSAEGQVLYLYTDGYADQFGGPKGKKFKYKPLNELIFSNSKKPMSEQREILDQTLEAWKGNLEQVDDILVIGIKL